MQVNYLKKKKEENQQLILVPESDSKVLENCILRLRLCTRFSN